MKDEEYEMNGFELFFWCFFFAMEVAWIYIGVQGVIEYIYTVFGVDDYNRVQREVAELRLEKSEEEVEFDRHYCSTSYVRFENEK